MRHCLILFTSALLLPLPIWAQRATESWPGLDASRLSTVYVIDDAGKETEGQLLRFDHDAVVILVGQIERRFEAQHVSRIQKRGDSLKTGAVVGGILGAALGGFVALAADCPNEGVSCPGRRVAVTLLSAGMYAAVGAGIDALLIGRTTLYEARTN